MRSIVIPVVLVIALTGTIPLQGKTKASTQRNQSLQASTIGIEAPPRVSDPPEETTRGADLVSIEGILTRIDGSLAVESEGFTCLVRTPLPATPETMEAGFVEGERVLLEGISAAGAPGGDKLVLRPARISSIET